MNISTKILDIVSIVISFTCIVHCLFFPALLILLPTLLSSINNELVHIVLLLFIYPISIYAIYFGFKKHHNKSLFFQGILGILILTLALFMHDISLLGFELESIFTIFGALVLAHAHFKNFRSNMISFKSSS
tara:strand:- start:125 stop:520 length:396 start_codon:yes stop_codon:yes gene_type:complete